MMHHLIAAVLGTALLAAMPFSSADNSATVPHPKVRIDTTLGTFVVELDRPRAPLTVANLSKK